MRHFLRAFSVALLLVVAAFGAASCSEDKVENRYTSLPANFVYRYTNTVPQLNSALNNLGEFATIRLDRDYYYFSNLTGTTQVNKTALSNYQNVHMGLCGFIVGLPNIPEPGSDVSTVVCYDLACPNCYEALAITRTLTLREGGYASCTSCDRTYNLNSQGIVSQGTGGKSLYRYRVSYGNNTLAISNR